MDSLQQALSSFYINIQKFLGPLFPFYFESVNPAAENTEWTLDGIRLLGGNKEPRGALHPAARDTAFEFQMKVLIGSRTLFQGAISSAFLHDWLP